MSTEQKQWGGSRRGSGRPKSLVEAERVTIWLEKDQREWLEGQGELSEVIRRLINQLMTADPLKPGNEE